jgi:hypothetical protein
MGTMAVEIDWFFLRMWEVKACRILVGKYLGTRPVTRPRRTSENNMKVNLGERMRETE